VFNEKEYANRLVLAVDEASKSLIMFEPDLKEGDEIQLMRRSVDMDYIHVGIDELKSKLQASTPVFSFYINCAGRAKPYAGGEFEDAEEVQKEIGLIPFMGFYSGVEVAKVKDKLQPLDWTGVLCMISE
jgi:FIST C domain.